MRQSREVKAETHLAIIAEASRLFRERGIDGTSVADVMQAAEKTHGGFYRHFDSKEQLLVASLDKAFNGIIADIESGFSRVPREKSISQFLAAYLSSRAVAEVGAGCPVAALSGDAMRSTEAVKRVFGTGARRIIDTIAEAMDGPEDEKRRRAARAFAMAAGALMIARASDPATAAFVLDAARSANAES